jgi:hemerythrin-like domain-containing protein
MRNDDEHRFHRRAFLTGSAVLIGARVAAPAPVFGAAPQEEEGQEDVTPAEDLMREHGALNRILLIYDEAISRIDAKKDFPPEVLASAASIVRRFVEEYHEKLEEDHLFPRFEKAGKLTDLVAVLKQQHAAGRNLTRTIESNATLAGLRNASQRGQLRKSLRLFVRMYRPHEAREDTVLFPALRSIIDPNDYEELGDQFEGKERELFGQDGFEKIVADIAGLEKKIGLYELSQFTPPG